MKLALFGGTFDPIHKAHLAIARASVQRYGLDRVLFIPAANPPHKEGATHASYEDRLRMVELAVEGEDRFEASRLEEFTARSYSIDTIERVQATLSPGDELFFLIGADAFAEIRTWRRWTDVVCAVQFIVVSRPGTAYEVPEGAVVHRIDSVALPISSSDIRRTLAAGERPDDVLPDTVLAYALSHQLYR